MVTTTLKSKRAPSFNHLSWNKQEQGNGGGTCSIAPDRF